MQMVDANRVPSALTNRNLENCSFKKIQSQLSTKKIAKGKGNWLESLEPAQKLFVDITLKLCTFFHSNFMTRCIPVEMCKKPNLKSPTGKLLDLYPQESLYVVQQPNPSSATTL